MTSASGRVMSDLLLIPLQDIQTGRFCALHRVFGRPGADKKFSKGWVTSAAGIYPVGIDVTRGPVFVCEGISTGLAAYEFWHEYGDPEAPGEYANQCTVLVCLDCGNLARQAPAIRRRWPDRRLTVVVDDDPAGRKAEAACMAAGFDLSWGASNLRGVLGHAAR
jgi:phage/plasmid primase-like uncharacterized protein